MVTGQEEGADAAGPLAQRSLALLGMVEALLARAKQPDLALDWEVIGALVATDAFVAVDRFKREIGWDACVERLRAIAPAAGLTSRVRRIEEVRNLVFLELDERVVNGDDVAEASTMTVLEFDADAKLRRIDLFT